MRGKESVAVDDPKGGGGVLGMRLLSIKNYSFLCSFSRKSGQIIDWHPTLRGGASVCEFLDQPLGRMRILSIENPKASRFPKRSLYPSLITLSSPSLILKTFIVTVGKASRSC